jgi:Fe-S-cluster containining protein
LRIAAHRASWSITLYSCKKCPGYCCSYPLIALERRDVERLARHFVIPYAVAERRFTRSAWGRKWIMRRKADRHYGRICQFFDTDKRRCTIYKARPSVCRSFPGEGRCGYYDFLAFERRAQNDPDFVALTHHK